MLRVSKDLRSLSLKNSFLSSLVKVLLWEWGQGKVPTARHVLPHVAIFVFLFQVPIPPLGAPLSLAPLTAHWTHPRFNLAPLGTHKSLGGPSGFFCPDRPPRKALLALICWPRLRRSFVLYIWGGGSPATPLLIIISGFIFF